MKPEQIQDNIENLIRLESDGRLTQKEKGRIREVLIAHKTKNHNVHSLSIIATRLCARDLRKLAIILLQHKVFLQCGICGGIIKSTQIYSVDHIKPLSDGGGDSLDNIQHSHDVCNFIKANMPGFASFYNDPEVIEVYVSTEKYKFLIERRSNKHKITGNDFDKPVQRYDLKLPHRGRSK